MFDVVEAYQGTGDAVGLRFRGEGSVLLAQRRFRRCLLVNVRPERAIVLGELWYRSCCTMSRCYTVAQNREQKSTKYKHRGVRLISSSWLGWAGLMEEWWGTKNRFNCRALVQNECICCSVQTTDRTSYLNKR
jgi:hypothetical protein